MLKNFYWLWEEELSSDLCNVLLSEVDWTGEFSAGVLQDPIKMKTVQDAEKRQTMITFEPQSKPMGAILMSHIVEANALAEWNFIITGVESTQIGRYEAEGFYDWHIDSYVPNAQGIQRKLSAILFLSNPDEYEGGELNIKAEGIKTLKPPKGSIIVFPSVLEHMVSPVTEGVRYTAVSWATGPAFR